MGDEGAGGPGSSTPVADRTRLLSRRAKVAPGASWLLQRAGATGQRARSSVWVHGETPAQFDVALALLREIMRGRPHVRLVLTSGDPSTVAYLKRAFPDDRPGAAPWNAPGAARRFFARLNPRFLLLLDGGRSLGDRAVSEATSREVPLVWLDFGGERIVRPRSGSTPDAPVSRGRRVVLADGSPSAAVRAAAEFVELLPDSPALPRVRQAWKVPSLRDRFGRSRAWATASVLLSQRRIDDWETLRERLGGPRSVLLLGNGPSSEDPRLRDLSHDCLVRVNWRWQQRGWLTKPQVVFAGDPATMTRIDSAIFGFWNVSLERAMLLRRLATRGPRPVEFATIGRLSPIIRDVDWPARPTNGALATILATSLRPERLVVAGIDLFRHPAGRYPGEVLARNDYSHVHEMETDLAIMELALRDFRGELVVLSDILREALDERAAAASSASLAEARAV